MTDPTFKCQSPGGFVFTTHMKRAGYGVQGNSTDAQGHKQTVPTAVWSAFNRTSFSSTSSQQMTAAFPAAIKPDLLISRAE